MTTECSIEVTARCRKLRHNIHNLVSAPNSDQIKQPDKMNGKYRRQIVFKLKCKGTTWQPQTLNGKSMNWF